MQTLGGMLKHSHGALTTDSVPGSSDGIIGQAYVDLDAENVGDTANRTDCIASQKGMDSIPWAVVPHQMTWASKLESANDILHPKTIRRY